MYELFVGHLPGAGWPHSRDFEDLLTKLPQIGYLIVDLLSADVVRRPTLSQAVARIQRMSGERHNTHRAREDLSGLPRLCLRPSRAGAILDRICCLRR